MRAVGSSHRPRAESSASHSRCWPSAVLQRYKGRRRRYMRATRFRRVPPPRQFPAVPRRDRIRIGYFSADFHNHATSYLIAELFERHDRSRFEVLGFSFGPLKLDEMNRRVSAAMDRFVDVRSMPDREVAELSRKLEVDIAVDLKGFTARQSRRHLCRARRPHPGQLPRLSRHHGRRVYGLSHRRPYADSRSRPSLLLGKDRLSPGQLSGQRFPACHLRKALRARRRGTAGDGIRLLLFQ